MSSPVKTRPDFEACIRSELKWLVAHLAVSKQWVAPATHGRLENLQKTLPLVAGFPVVVVGEFSAGKSSLINELIGAQVLPAGLSITTRWTTRISYGAPGASIRLGSGSEYAYPQTFSVDKLSFAKLSHAGTDVDATNLKRWLEYITQHVAADCDEIQVKWPAEFLSQQIVLYDTPGVNSEDKTHRERTHLALSAHDVCALFVFPCIGAGRESVINLDVARIQQFQYPLFAISKVDLAEYKRQLLEVEAVVRAKLVARMPVPPKKIFLISIKKSETNDLNELKNQISRLAEQVLSQATPARLATELTGLCETHWQALQRTEQTLPTIFRLRALGVTAKSLVDQASRPRTVSIVCPHCMNIVESHSSVAGSWWRGQIACKKCRNRIDLHRASPLVRKCEHCSKSTFAAVGVCGRCGSYSATDPQTVLLKYQERLRLLAEIHLEKQKRNQRALFVFFFVIGLLIGVCILVALAGAGD